MDQFCGEQAPEVAEIWTDSIFQSKIDSHDRQLHDWYFVVLPRVLVVNVVNKPRITVKWERRIKLIKIGTAYQPTEQMDNVGLGT